MTTTKNDMNKYNQAFPSEVVENNGMDPCSGLTKREYATIKILAGLPDKETFAARVKKSVQLADCLFDQLDRTTWYKNHQDDEQD